MKSGNKVLIIGLDGATLRLILPWVKDGSLPNMAKFVNDGVYGDLMSTIPPHTPIAWTSFMTGTNLGKHGIYDFFGRDASTYRPIFFNSSHRKDKTIWSIISDAGGSVGVLNVPMTYPPEPLNGVMIAGMDSPVNDETIAYPKDIYQEINNLFGEYMLDVTQSPDTIHTKEYINEIIKMTEKRTQVAQYLMKKYQWDLFNVVFVAPDRIMHHYWKYMDKTHPDYDAGISDDLSAGMLRVYQAVDKAIGELLSECPPGTNTLIMSDHGAGANRKVFAINDWLIKQGYLNENRSIALLIRKKVLQGITGIILKYGRRVKGLLGSNIGKRLIKISKPPLEALDFDWPNSRAYSEGLLGSVFINLKGRDVCGIVEPGEEYERLRGRIIKDMEGIVDPDNNEKVIDKVYKREDIYRGKEVDSLPDLFIVCRPGYRPTGRNLWRMGDAKKEGFLRKDIWSGYHRMEGVFMAKGDAMQKGKGIGNSHIIDIAPTALYLLGLPIPAHMDGKVIQDAILPDYFNAMPVQYSEAYEDKPKEAYTDEETQAVEERLKNLGYL